jgi:hypothetical protein
MELPIVQYKRHRLAYSVAAFMGLLAASQGCYWFVEDGATSFLAWIFMIIGFIVFIRCCWMAFDKSVVLELNHQGIRYKGDLYGWDTLCSYAIRKEVGEASLFMYLLLRFKERKDQLEIQLDWMDDMESVPEQMAAYASVFKINFDGIIKKEI